MKDLAIPARDYAAKWQAAKPNFLTIDELRRAAIPADGDSFIVGKTMYVFVREDGSPDDGVTSVIPVALPLGMAKARYRRATIRFPLAKS